MKNIFFSLFLISNCLCAQIISPELVSASGNTMESGNYILCASLGELSIPTITQNQHILTQGFHQEEIISNTTALLVPELLSQQIRLFPNPTLDELSIYISEEYSSAHISITNLSGGVVKKFIMEPFKNAEKISLKEISQGVYFIQIILDSRKPIIHQIHKI